MPKLGWCVTKKCVCVCVSCVGVPLSGAFSCCVDHSSALCQYCPVLGGVPATGRTPVERICYQMSSVKLQDPPPSKPGGTQQSIAHSDGQKGKENVQDKKRLW